MDFREKIRWVWIFKTCRLTPFSEQNKCTCTYVKSYTVLFESCGTFLRRARYEEFKFLPLSILQSNVFCVFDYVVRWVTFYWIDIQTKSQNTRRRDDSYFESDWWCFARRTGETD